MEAALAEAARAPAHGDVPVGAVLVDPDGQPAAADHNRREELQDPTAHAEVLVLSAAARRAGRWRLDGHTLVVTLEPCAMCAGAAVAARLERIVYGAADLKAGAAWSLYNIPQDRRLNHRMDLVAGVLEEECASILAGFFEQLRSRSPDAAGGDDEHPAPDQARPG
ncbi:MAG: nucleoside deaminase [bacterium]|nr:nucleoside deaminase [bacterium]MDE0352856.1 nucleoside deaminase [bacterium]